MDHERTDAAGRAEVVHSPTPTAHYRITHGEHHPQTSPSISELRPPPQRYSHHAAHLACHTRVNRSNPPKDSNCTHHVPRTAVLWRLLAAMIVVLVFVQAVSCGMFFCVRVPFGHRPYVDYRDLISELDAGTPTEAADAGKPVVAASTAYSWQQPTAPKLIPRIVHQTSHTTRLSATAKQLMRSWQERNEDSWQVRLYNDDACLNFVRREFPEYFEAYMNLPKNVERADFFRYMVLLRLGGAYADLDVECRQPLDSVIQPADTLLVGWDDEAADTITAAHRNFARQRQVASWFFAAAPGHPVLRRVCDHIAHNAMTMFSANTVRDTLERTGQGVFTDMVLQWALEHPPSKRDDPWKVRILPRIAFGIRASELGEKLKPELPGIVVLHHFQASWQGRWPAHRKALQTLIPWTRGSGRTFEPLERVVDSNITHYPVSVDFYPPFTMMTDLVGTGDKQAASDVSAAITTHGTWQPAVAPYRRPAVVEALVGALSRHSSSASNSRTDPAAAVTTAESKETVVAAGSAAVGSGTETGSRGSVEASPAASHKLARKGVLVDIGAGHGFFSLAAAARGHRVVAFETSPGSLAAFKASIAYNGFQHLINVHAAGLGAAAGVACQQHAVSSATAHKSAAATDEQQGAAESSIHTADMQHIGDSADVAPQQPSTGKLLGQSGTTGTSHRQHGHLSRLRNRMSNGQDLECAEPIPVLSLSSVLSNNTDVAVVRISAGGQEGWVIQGALEFFKHKQKPDVIYMEFWPAAMQAAGYKEPMQLLQQLYDLGYTDIAHAGRVCDARWQNVTQLMRSQGTFSVSAHNMAQQQPTWCKLRPEHFQLMVDLADAEVPENVLFVKGHEASTLQQSSVRSDSSSQVKKPHGSTVAATASKGSSLGDVERSSTEYEPSAAHAAAALTRPAMNQHMVLSAKNNHQRSYSTVSRSQQEKQQLAARKQSAEMTARQVATSSREHVGQEESTMQGSSHAGA